MELMMEINDRCIHKKKVVNASKNEVWLKWTTHQGLKSFIGDDNKIDFRPGGAFEIYFIMDAPEGSRGGEGNKILSFLPEKMLSFSWNAPPTIPEIRTHSHKTWVVVQFEAINENQTVITLDHLGWLDGEKWDETIDYFENAWNIVLSSLGKSFSR